MKTVKILACILLTALFIAPCASLLYGQTDSRYRSQYLKYADEARRHD